MKRVSAFICVLGIMVCLTACGGGEKEPIKEPSSSNTQKESVKESEISNDLDLKKDEKLKSEEDFTGLTGDEIISKYIKDINSITSEEYLKICTALADYSYDENLMHEETPIYDALISLSFDGTLKDPENFVKEALKSDSPLIRAEGIEVAADYLDECMEDTDCANELKTIVNDEEDPYVLLTLFERAYHFTDTDIFNRAMQEKESEYPEIRAETVKFVLNEQDESTKPYLLEYLEDENLDVRSEAIRTIAYYEDETLIPYVVEFISNPENEIYYWYGLSVLETYARYEPFYNKSSEAAWNAMMDFYKQDVKEGVPSYNDIKILQVANENDEDFIKWCNETSYVNKDEIVNAMYNIIKSDLSSWIDVQEAIRVVKIYGSDEQYKAIEDMINNRTNTSMKDELLSVYNEGLN